MADKHKGGKLAIKIDEPSYIMGIVSITPRICYSQGNEWDVDLVTMDDFHKPALDGIGFQDLITERMAWWDTVNGVKKVQVNKLHGCIIKLTLIRRSRLRKSNREHVYDTEQKI